MKNFKLLEDDTISVDGHTLYRIEATRDFANVNCGDIGGYVESPDNLGDEAWVFGNARVRGNSQVYENARVYGRASVYGEARVCGDGLVCGNALVCGTALVSWTAMVCGDAWVYGDSRILKGSVKGARDVINITSNGALYLITILPRHIQIGCQCHTRTAWFNFTDEEIRTMDGEKAVVWWKTWKPILKSICDANASGDEQC